MRVSGTNQPTLLHLSKVCSGEWEINGNYTLEGPNAPLVSDWFLWWISNRLKSVLEPETSWNVLDWKNVWDHRDIEILSRTSIRHRFDIQSHVTPTIGGRLPDHEGWCLQLERFRHFPMFKLETCVIGQIGLGLAFGSWNQWQIDANLQWSPAFVTRLHCSNHSDRCSSHFAWKSIVDHHTRLEVLRSNII